MRLFLLVLAALTLTCGGETSAPQAALDTREASEFAYVGAPELLIRARPADDAPVVAKKITSESVSILARQGEWVEVRIATGSGWARAADLSTAADAVREEEKPTPRFRLAPSPASAPMASGSIYIEADVNTDGDVTSTRIVSNTTGNDMLARQNEAALRKAKFHPIVQKGKRVPFQYYHRIDYERGAPR